MQDLEEKILESGNWKLKFYYRYVDDILFAAPLEDVDDILEQFNKYHERLKFSIEMEHERRLSFLDLSLTVKNHTIYIDWYHKKTFSGRMLSYYSNHSKAHKTGTIFSLIDRALLLSHPIYHQKNIELVIRILLDNAYPLQLIFNTINRRINNYIFKKLNFSDKNDTALSDESKNIIVFPYVRNISESITTAFDKSHYIVGYRCLNKLNQYIKVHKDKNNRKNISNVIYKICCKDCDATYIGQTKRQLGTRVKEHRNNIRMDPSKHSVVTEHIIKENHTFDWDNAQILDTENNFYKRLISETIHIKEHKNSINLNKDTELLDVAYFDILKELSVDSVS